MRDLFDRSPTTESPREKLGPGAVLLRGFCRSIEKESTAAMDPPSISTAGTFVRRSTANRARLIPRSYSGMCPRSE